MKVAHRGKGVGLLWRTIPDLVPLPVAALNVSSKKVPEDLRIMWPAGEWSDNGMDLSDIARQSGSGLNQQNQSLRKNSPPRKGAGRIP